MGSGRCGEVAFHMAGYGFVLNFKGCKTMKRLKPHFGPLLICPNTFEHFSKCLLKLNTLWATHMQRFKKICFPMQKNWFIAEDKTKTVKELQKGAVGHHGNHFI